MHTEEDTDGGGGAICGQQFIYRCVCVCVPHWLSTFAHHVNGTQSPPPLPQPRMARFADAQ